MEAGKERIYRSREEWLRARTGYLTASDAAALWGDHPRKTKFHIWQEKARRLDPVTYDEASASERSRWGRRIRAAVLEGFAEESGIGVKPTPEHLLVCLDEHRMAASLDATTEDGAPVATKNVDGLVFKDNWAKEGRTVVDCPLAYEVQVAVQCLVTGSDHGWLVALVGGNDICWKRVEPPRKTLDSFLTLARNFWEKVDAGREPDPEGRDGVVLRALYPEVGERRLAADTEAESWAHRALDLKDKIETLEDERKWLEALLLDEMENARRLEGMGWQMTRSIVKEKEVAAHTRKEYVRSQLRRVK